MTVKELKESLEKIKDSDDLIVYAFEAYKDSQFELERVFVDYSSDTPVLILSGF